MVECAGAGPLVGDSGDRSGSLWRAASGGYAVAFALADTNADTVTLAKSFAFAVAHRSDGRVVLQDRRGVRLRVASRRGDRRDEDGVREARDHEHQQRIRAP